MFGGDDENGVHIGVVKEFAIVAVRFGVGALDGGVQALLIDIADGDDSDVFAFLLKALDSADVSVTLTATTDDADADTAVSADDLRSARKGVSGAGFPLGSEGTKPCQPDGAQKGTAGGSRRLPFRSTLITHRLCPPFHMIEAAKDCDARGGQRNAFPSARDGVKLKAACCGVVC
jgi:hypothetical protein